jgi:radical SAM/Cys-rich protein
MALASLSDALAVPAYDFDAKLAEHGQTLTRSTVQTLQVNVGKYCNQACHHCHVEAGPLRTEKMTSATAERVIAVLERSPEAQLLDITGGAPELNPVFRYLVREGRRLDRRVMDRCNLTVLEVAGQEDLAAFLAEHRVEIVASLPCYSKENVEKQRGNGVFEPSIRALRSLNALGYGKEGTGLELSLVYNPLGAFLPGAQAKLEQAYKAHLREEFGIEFTRLFTIANMPIKRFEEMLLRQGKLESYMNLLVESFNPAAAEGVMCRTMVSVDWDGRLSDCDFNQMLDLPVAGSKRSIWDIDALAELAETRIVAGPHCFGCAAGSGSSCGGALTTA